MIRISKRTREEAIEACLLIADTHLVLGDYYDPDLDPEPKREAVSDLLTEVVCALPGSMLVDDGIALIYLEAAALLHDGWSPGDPVRLLKES